MHLLCRERVGTSECLAHYVAAAKEDLTLHICKPILLVLGFDVQRLWDGFAVADCAFRCRIERSMVACRAGSARRMASAASSLSRSPSTSGQSSSLVPRVPKSDPRLRGSVISNGSDWCVQLRGYLKRD